MHETAPLLAPEKSVYCVWLFCTFFWLGESVRIFLGVKKDQKPGAIERGTARLII